MANKRRGKRKNYQRDATTEKSNNMMWWWIGSAIALVGLILVVVWFAVGPGKPEPAAPTAVPTATEPPAATAAPTEADVEPEPEETEVPVEEEEEEPTTMSMPEEPTDRSNMYDAPPEMQIDTDKSYVATISTEKGDIVVQLDAQTAPQTVNNFVFLSKQGFYDNLTFHRVEPSFVIQGGDPLGTGTGGPGYTVPAEIELKHVKGAIAMARQGDQVNPERASSGSQFYITLEETPFLDGAYTAFGEVVEGMDVVQSITVGDVIETISIAEE
jgi:cyclophilin family peptidyl-prolyl cis-trans isomerase